MYVTLETRVNVIEKTKTTQYFNKNTIMNLVITTSYFVR